MLALTPEQTLSSPKVLTLWDDDHWGIALNQFVRASGLSISVYGIDGTRTIGPIVDHPLVHMIEETGAWKKGACEKSEIALAISVLQSGDPRTSHFGDCFYVHALPLRFRGEMCGVMIVGWAFDQFADPIRCAKLARVFNLPENIVWKVAREVAPISRERINIFISLLNTLSTSILNQHALVDEARDANRAKDQFLATASHELKTPLTSIKLRVDFLQHVKNPTQEQISKGLDAISNSVKIQTKLVDDLLESSRVNTGKLRLDLDFYDPYELVRSSLETITPAAEAKGIQVTLNAVPHILKYKGDVDRLQQVYWNLLNNAVKFTPSGGFISVSARESGGSYVVHITDSGRGIDKALLPKLFETFFQVKTTSDPSNNGLGLGLSVARSIINLHGGQLSATSEGLERGSCFTVQTPSVSHAEKIQFCFGVA